MRARCPRRLSPGIGRFLLVASALVLAPSPADADVLKLDIKLSAGANTTTIVDLLETGRQRDTFVGWQIGLGARVRRDLWFAESTLSFNRWAIRRSQDGVRFKGRVASFELPFIGGVIPYKNPYFRLLIYGAYVNHFNTRISATVTNSEGESADVKIRPKEADFAIYLAIARVGIGFDLFAFNVDFNYSLSMNSLANRTRERVSYHQLQLNLGYLF